MIIEQAVRVIVILAGTYYLRVLTDGTILEAVLISTVASFFGGLAAIIHMYIATVLINTASNMVPSVNTRK